MEFAINHNKYCIGDNYYEKYKTVQLLKEYFLCSKESEYSKNNIGKIQFNIDNNQAHKKNTLIYFVNHNYSLTDDLKLTTKSLISKYLETLLSHDDYIDTINTINILFEAFSDEIDDELLRCNFQTFVPKLFLKQILPLYLIDQEQANEFDMSYNDIIIFQLKMINYIAQHAKVENVICVIDIPELTNEINDYLIQMHSSYNIIFTNKWNCSLDIEDILLFDYKVIDLYDENKIYNLGLSKGICTLEEVKTMLKEIINEEYVKANKSIINKLKI